MFHPNHLLPSVFSNSPLNRLNNLRHSHTLLSAALPSTSVYILFSPTLHILFTTSTLVLLSEDSLPTSHQESKHLKLFLGVSDNVAYFAIRLPPSFDIPTYLKENPTFNFQSLRSIITNLTIPHNHAAILAHARSLFEFHARHQYCGLCGSPTVSHHAGSRRRCIRNRHQQEPHVVNSDHSTCNGMWFPRTDPVVIMLVLHPSQHSVLLARHTRYRPNTFYSCLAGFMEHGEALQDAVRREVAEEAGIHVRHVRFFTSQPWPFPYSLMLACIALAEDTTITIDTNELQHAKWFNRHEVATMVARARSSSSEQSSDLVVPPTTTIAGTMCAAFAQSDPITAFPTSDPSSSPQTFGNI